MLGDGAGVHTQRAGLGNKPEPWAVSVCGLLFPSATKYVCGLHRCSISFLSPSFKSHCFANQLRELVFPVLDPRAGGPKVLFEPLAPQEGSPSL